MPKVTKPAPNAVPTPVVGQRDFPFKRGSIYYIKFPDPQDPSKLQELILPSVTTVLQVTSNKQALVNWAAREAARVALAHPELSVEEVVAKSINARKESAIDLGKAIHKFAEDYNNGVAVKATDLATELQPFAEAFLSFVGLHKPRILFTEVTVFNVTHGYAGTADLIAVMSNGNTAILDWKTGKSTYKESHLQQMAYSNAEYIYTKDHQVIPMPKVHEQYLVHLKDNGTANLIPVKEPFQKFLDALAYYPTAKWLQEW